MAVKLSKPIKRGDKEITEVNVREPSAGELRGLDNHDVLRMSVSAHRKLLPRISCITANEFDQLPPKDLIALQSEVVSFFTDAE